MSALFWIVVGVTALLVGSEGVVRGGKAVASRAGVSELAIGLVVASVGTSLPEMFTILNSSRPSVAAEASAIGVGNILGSNLFLLLALLGTVAIARDMAVDRRIWRRDGMALAAGSLALLLFSIDGEIVALEGAALMAGFAGWLWMVARGERSSVEEDVGPEDETYPMWAEGLRALAGLALLVEGADLVVGQGVALAESMGVGPVLVGVLAGIGTSLPEIGVSLQAGRSGSSDLSLGNLLGSALVNALACTGLAATVGTVLVPSGVLGLEMPFLLASTVVVLALMWERRDLTRAEGIALLALFGLYLTLRIVQA